MIVKVTEKESKSAMRARTSLMELETLEAPIKIAQQLQQNNKSSLAAIIQKIKHFNPYDVMMVGRGSSDHAGVFAKYLIEIELGLATFSAAPSVTTVYHKRLKLNKTLVIVISQSGRSPDIIQQVEQCRHSGALCIGLLNDTSAPLAEAVDYVIPLYAGAEYSVAATKSFMATLSALLQLVANWSDNRRLQQDLTKLPEQLQKTISQKAQIHSADLQHKQQLIVLGRGLSYAIAREIALKLKEVCAIQAEAFSSAEFLHGPAALVNENCLIVDIEVEDESFLFHQQVISELQARGAIIVSLRQNNDDINPRLAPLLILQRFYLDIEKVARKSGIDPDNPEGLKKITETL